MERRAIWGAFRVAALFALAAAAWYLIADLWIEQVFGRILGYELVDFAKDIVFAAITAWLAFIELRRQMLNRYQAEATQVQAELDLRAAHRDLEQRVLARTADLARANSTLQAEILERNRAEKELSALLQVSRDVASTLDLKPLLDLILDQLEAMVGYTSAAIFVPDGGTVTILNHRGTLPLHARLFHSDLEDTPGYVEVMRLRVPVIISDVQGDPLSLPPADESGVRTGQHAPGQSGSWMGVPLIIKDRVIALMQVEHTEPSYFTPHHSQLALAIANEAAVAIENARLYKEAQRAAALDERQRLARDLHDSLSQALFGIALGANATRETLAGGGDVTESLDLVLSLADSALEDLRSLIFELRPEALSREGLIAALARQIQQTCVRHQLEATCDLGDEPDLPIEIKEAIYRIAQEALNNAVRHARAKRVEVHLRLSDTAAVLEVCDDGIGYSPSTPLPGHIGIQSMRERAARVGGALEIISTPGGGACVHATIALASAAMV